MGVPNKGYPDYFGSTFFEGSDTSQSTAYSQGGIVGASGELFEVIGKGQLIMLNFWLKDAGQSDGLLLLWNIDDVSYTISLINSGDFNIRLLDGEAYLKATSINMLTRLFRFSLITPLYFSRYIKLYLENTGAVKSVQYEETNTQRMVVE